MEELLKTLTEYEIEGLCVFANCYLTQIPYMDKQTIKGLNKDYLIKRLKAKQPTLKTTLLKLSKVILKKNLQLKTKTLKNV